MSSLTKENIPHLCRACLRKLIKNENGPLTNEREKVPAYYHIDRTNNLHKWMTIINPLEDVTRLQTNQQYKQFPQYVCRSCYENFRHLNDFKEMVVHSFSVLSKLLAGDEEKKPTQIDQPVIEREVVVKSEPIDDYDDDDDDNDEDFDDDEYMDNDWDMDNAFNSNETDLELLEESANTEHSEVLNHAAAKPSYTTSIENDDVGQPKATKAYKCPVCNISYVHKYTYVAHVRKMHLGIEQAFECDICHKTYTQFCNLYRHMRMAHDQSLRQYKCEYANCNRSFRQLTTRRKHYEEFHNHETLPNHVERVSKESFKQEELKNSKLTTPGPYSSSSITKTESGGQSSPLFYKRNFICTICTKTFETSYDLKVHTNNDHKKDMKYRCNICGAHKISQLKLDEHWSSVHNGRNVICHICQKALKSKSHLRQHIISVHSGIKPYSCEYCPATFAAKNTLKVHTRIHTGEKPFKCSICERRFTQLTPMKKHLITHEKGHRNAVE